MTKLEVAVNRFMEHYRDADREPLTKEGYLKICKREIERGMKSREQWLADWNDLLAAYFSEVVNE